MGDLLMHLFLIEGKMMRLEFTSAVVLGGGRFRARERRYVVPRSDPRGLGKGGMEDEDDEI